MEIEWERKRAKGVGQTQERTKSSLSVNRAVKAVAADAAEPGTVFVHLSHFKLPSKELWNPPPLPGEGSARCCHFLSHAFICSHSTGLCCEPKNSGRPECFSSCDRQKPEVPEIHLVSLCEKASEKIPTYLHGKYLRDLKTEV